MEDGDIGLEGGLNPTSLGYLLKMGVRDKETAKLALRKLGPPPYKKGTVRSCASILKRLIESEKNLKALANLSKEQA